MGSGWLSAMFAVLAVSVVLSGVGVVRRAWWPIAAGAFLAMASAFLVFNPYALLLAPAQLVLAVGFRWGLSWRGWVGLLAGVTAAFTAATTAGWEWAILAFVGFVVAAAFALVLGEPRFRYGAEAGRS